MQNQVKIAISDIRKALKDKNTYLNGVDLIVDKLEELEERISKIESIFDNWETSWKNP